MKRIQITFLALLISMSSAYAQVGKLFDTDHQLSNSFISQVYQDQDGFIWVLTRNGINKYDGYQFHTIKKEQEQQHGMTSNYANCITQDHRGLFYLGMYGALLTYDGKQFDNVEVRNLAGNTVAPYMISFLTLRNGQILAATSGHGVLKIIDRGHAQQLGGPLTDIHTVYSMVEDVQGHLWMVTNNKGLIEYDGNALKHYFTAENQRTTLQRLCLDRDGNLYVGTIDHGVYVRLVNQDTFKHIPSTGNNRISALCLRRDGRVMIGYDGRGVAIYDPKTEQLDDNPYYSRDVDLRMSKVYSILEDNNGNIWLGLMQKGIYMQPKETAAFHYMGYKQKLHNQIGQACVISTHIDDKGRYWVGTDKDGLYLLDSRQQLQKHFSGDHFPSSVMSLAEDCLQNIWVGSFGQGFGYINTSTLQFTPFSGYSKTDIIDFQVRQNGDLWIATLGSGLLHLTPGTHHLKAYTAIPNAQEDELVNSIVNDYLYDITLSSDEKRLYVATTQGLCCLDIERNNWTSVFGRNCILSGHPVRVVKEYDGQVWIGTNDGLYCYDIEKKNMQLYTTEHGLADNGIASIEQDAQGRLWLGTDHGLSCFDPKTTLSESYFVDNGLQSNEFCDRASSTYLLSSVTHAPQTMLFGGVGGITWFTPEKIKPEQWDANVRLVEFVVGGMPVNSKSQSHGYQICDTTVIAANNFQLSHHDNAFTVRFSTLTYDTPDHTTYLYSINDEPYNRLRPGTNELSLTHLEPGTYCIRVKAERYNRMTSEREFTVVIHRPWYATWWAYCLYFALLVTVAWRFLCVMKQREKDRLRLQEHIHAEEMSNAKLHFFMNISHEIRTPMTLIVTPILSLIKSEEDPQRKRVYEAIKRNAERILHLIGQMMDIWKIDKGLMQMRMSETDLVGFINDIHALFEHQAKSRQIRFTFQHQMEVLPVWIDRKNFDKVIINILSNAFKFTPTGGAINIRLQNDPENALITISDDGEKIPESELDKIFQRFYQTSTEVNDRNPGTGIGLDLARSLVELHHGTISAHNLQQGCEFVVTIPLGNSHLTPDEMANEEVSASPNSLLDDMQEKENHPSSVAHNQLPITHHQTSGTQHPIIVIAEDDNEISDYLVSELQKDYKVEAVSNGKEAFSATLRLQPNLVLSDVMMPELDGIALCARIKTNPNTKHIPVVLLTAKNREEDKLEGLDTGADAYIVKPFNMELLRRTVSNIINSHQMLRLKYQRNDQLEENIDMIKMKSPDEKLMQRVMAVINQHLGDPNLNVDMIATQVGISRVHLYRKMKELTGQAPHEFIRNIRLKNAANLLTKKGMNISEVTYACGFANTGSFSNIFKKFYGVSPRDYVKEHGR